MTTPDRLTLQLLVADHITWWKKIEVKVSFFNSLLTIRTLGRHVRRSPWTERRPKMAGEIAGSLLLAAVVTKLVDLIRKVDPNDRFWKGTWIVLAMILGLVLALVFEISVLAELGLEPENELQGIIGQILTGLVVGATSSSYHELWDALSSLAKLSRARAAAEPLTTAGLRMVWDGTIPKEDATVSKLRDDQATCARRRRWPARFTSTGGPRRSPGRAGSRNSRYPAGDPDGRSLLPAGPSDSANDGRPEHPVTKSSTGVQRTRTARAHILIGAIGSSTPPSHAYLAPHGLPQHPPARVLAIALDRQPLALRSTRNRLRTAMQGCALRAPCAGVARGPTAIKDDQHRRFRRSVPV